MRKQAALPVLALLAALALTAGTGSGSSARAKGQRLQAFGSCGELLGYVKGRALPLVGAYGLGGGPLAVATPSVGQERAQGTPSAGAPSTGGGTQGVDFSGTNVQEEGVDEPDIVKTDGAQLYVVNGSTLRVLDVGSGRPRLVGSLQLGQGSSHELLLRGSRLLVLSRAALSWIEPLPGSVRMASPSFAPGRPATTLTEVDVSNPSSPRITRTLRFEADYLSARLVGGAARIVLSSALPQPIEFVQPQGTESSALAAAATRNRAIVRRTGLRAWLPRYTLTDRRARTKASGALVQCRNVRRPASFSGLGMLTVLTVDLDAGLEPVDSDAVLADGRVVYASRESLYVATERWADRPVAGGGEVADGVTTAIHKFDIGDPRRTQYRASGQVTGVLLNQWSLSEQAGALRVASTDTPTWWNPGPQRESESFVTVLRERDGALTAVGRVGDLGKGERIYAVRFIGDTGYVVTFRQVDPLYTLDLSDPERPAVLGELKIPGFSSYLHPIGEDLILGVGQDATGEGRVVGSQLSIFDVSNLRKPARLHQVTLGRGTSEAEYDHRAFLYWPQTRLAVIPLQTSTDENGAGDVFSGVVGFAVGRARGIDRLGKVTHPSPGVGQGAGRVAAGTPIRRSLVVRGTLYTVSDAGVLGSSLTSLAELGWAPFPQP